MVVLGDLSEKGEETELIKARDILNQLNEQNISYFPVLGNHDVRQLNDSGLNFQKTFSNDFLTAQCRMINADLDLSGRILEDGKYYQNYAFGYGGKRFVFLDWVSEFGQVGIAAEWPKTKDFLKNQLQRNELTFLFSHHPMVDDLVEGAFNSLQIADIAGVIRETNSKNNILGSFGGHIHSYYDPEGLIHEMYLSTRNIDYSLTFTTPEGIHVYGTEALMSASYDSISGSRNVVRIVEVGNASMETYVDCECPALNPYIIGAKGIGFFGDISVTVSAYAFTQLFSVHPINYSLYLDGNTTCANWVESSEIKPKSFAPQKLSRGLHRINVTVTLEGTQFSESIERIIDVGRVRVVLKCPTDIVVTDPYGRSVGKSINEIPGATYDEVDVDGDGYLDKVVEIPALIDDNYVVTLNGTGSGTYTLLSKFNDSLKTTWFNATSIPVSSGSIHQYVINWIALSQGGNITVRADNDGDGVFEHNFTSDSVLTQSEFLAQIPEFSSPVILPFIMIVTLMGLIALSVKRKSARV